MLWFSRKSARRQEAQKMTSGPSREALVTSLRGKSCEGTGERS